VRYNYMKNEIGVLTRYAYGTKAQGQLLHISAE
jgi:hypothetical protein